MRIFRDLVKIMFLFYPGALAWVLLSPRYTDHNVAGYSRGWLNDTSVSNLVWQRASDFALDEAIYRWGESEIPGGCDGLGCGISWALHPDFCYKLLPLFPERDGLVSFVDCNALRSAVTRALNTWSMNSVSIEFNDITDECQESLYRKGECAAELLLVPSDLAQFGDAFAAKVVNDQHNLNFKPITTAGIHLRHGLGLRSSTMYVSTKGCWSLDATFCYTFNRLRENTDDATVQLIIELAAFGVFAIAAIVTLGVCAKIILAYLGVTKYMSKTDRRRQTVAEEISQFSERTTLPQSKRALASIGASLGDLHVLPLTITLIGLTFGPVFYLQFYLPCWQCFDFEATIAHEVGHVLGFGHPDAQPDQNLQALPENTTVCNSPLDYVQLTRPLQAMLNRETSVMQSFTIHRDRTCLLEDDLEGLNYLYPTCGSQRATPLCLKQTLLLGYVRLIIAAFIPFLGCVLFVVLLKSLTEWHLKRELRKLKASRQASRRKGRLATLLIRASAVTKRHDNAQPASNDGNAEGQPSPTLQRILQSLSVRSSRNPALTVTTSASRLSTSTRTPPMSLGRLRWLRGERASHSAAAHDTHSERSQSTCRSAPDVEQPVPPEIAPV